MHFLKCFLMTAALLLLAKETLARAQYAMACEYGTKDVVTGISEDGEMWFCYPVGKTCTISKLVDKRPFSGWTDFAEMITFRAVCSDDATVDVCFSAYPAWTRAYGCPFGEETAGFFVKDYQRRRNLKGESKKKGEPVFQEGSQMEVEIDGVMMVIVDAKEQE
jgi:hypothetical protein